mgnify:CR=1 FL=1
MDLTCRVRAECGRCLDLCFTAFSFACTLVLSSRSVCIAGAQDPYEHIVTMLYLTKNAAMVAMQRWDRTHRQVGRFGEE